MEGYESKSEALVKLQDEVYREKILRAREMSPAEKLQEVFDLTTEVFETMHAGVMSLKKFENSDEGWLEVERQLLRIRGVDERDRYSSFRPEKP